MKCLKCNKDIPEVSTTCPFCDHPVGVYVEKEDIIDLEELEEKEEKKEEINFGSIDDINYDNKIEIKTYVKERASKKVLLGGLAVVVIVVGIFAGLILSVFSKNNDNPTKIFVDTTNQFFDYFIDNYTSNNAVHSGSYDLNLKVNDQKFTFKGEYGFDTKNKILKLKGNMRDPRESLGGIILDYHEFDFDLYQKEDELYFTSEQLFNDKNVLFPLPDDYGLLGTKNYDISSLISGIKEALVSGFKASSVLEEADSVDYLGETINVNKRFIVLDNKGKKAFLKAFYGSLLDDSNFINEVARTQKVQASDVETKLENYIDEVDHKYSGKSDYKSIFAIYYRNNHIYRIEYDAKEEKNFKYVLNVGETKYYFDYFEEDKNIFSSTLVVTTKEKEDYTMKNFEITFDTDKKIIDIDLKTKIDKRPNVKHNTYENVLNVRDFSPNDYINLKNNLSYYIADTSWVDSIPETFKNKCNKELSCKCEENAKTCKCNYNSKIITCPVEDVTS